MNAGKIQIRPGLAVEWEPRKEDNYGNHPGISFGVRINDAWVWRDIAVWYKDDRPPPDQIRSYVMQHSGRWMKACGNYLIRLDRKLQKNINKKR